MPERDAEMALAQTHSTEKNHIARLVELPRRDEHRMERRRIRDPLHLQIPLGRLIFNALLCAMPTPARMHKTGIMGWRNRLWL